MLLCGRRDRAPPIMRLAKIALIAWWMLRASDCFTTHMNPPVSVYTSMLDNKIEKMRSFALQFHTWETSPRIRKQKTTCASGLGEDIHKRGGGDSDRRVGPVGGITSDQTFVATYIAYATCYFARNNAAVAKAPLLAMLGPGAILSLWGRGFVPGVSVSATTALGMLDGGFLLAYALGSFVVPVALDLDNQRPWDVVWSALFVVSLAQLGLWSAWTQFLSRSFQLDGFALALASCMLNGAAQSVLYPTCKQLLADRFGASGTVLGNWNTCYYLGGAVSTLFAAALCGAWGWQSAFLGPSLFVLAMSCGVFAFSKTWDQPSIGYAPNEKQVKGTDKQSKGAGGVGWGRWLKLLQLDDLELRVVAFQYFVVKLIRYAFALWLPLLMAAGAADVSLVEVGGGAALFELGSMLGSVGIGILVESIGLQALPFFVFGSTLGLSVLLPFVSTIIGGMAGLSLQAVLLLFCLGSATGAGETLLGSISPIFYAQKTVNTYSVTSAVASVNGYGSLGTVVAALALPLLAVAAGKTGLAGAFSFLAPLAWLATISAFTQIIG